VFSPRAVNMIFVVDKMALKQFLPTTCSYSSVITVPEVGASPLIRRVSGPRARN
jgi:hypothetical protein